MNKVKPFFIYFMDHMKKIQPILYILFYGPHEKDIAHFYIYFMDPMNKI